MTESMDAAVDPGTFERLLDREELRRARTSEVLTVAVVDLDGLHAVNANHGRVAGDDLIESVWQALHATLRSVDVAARTGVDEFSVLLHATDGAGADRWASRFEELLERETRDHPAAPATCALGLACTTEAPTLLEAAARARRRMEAVQAVRRLHGGEAPPD